MVTRNFFSTVVLLFAMVFAIGGCGGGGGGDSAGTTTPTMNSDPVEVTLGNDAKLVFPIGSLPTDANVSVTEGSPPPLIDKLTAVGTTYYVHVDKELTLPVEITLPVPLGEDPRNLVILRIESSGRISMLQTDIENDTLVAKTPGFSAFVTARLERFYEEYKPKITGPEFLPVGTVGEYHETVSLSKMPGLQAKWEVYQYVGGAARIVDSNPAIFKNSSVRLSAEKAATVTLKVNVIEPITGLNAVAYKRITMLDSLESGDELDIAIRGPGVVKMTEPVILQARILNTDVINIKEWTWSIDGSEVEKYECNSSCSTDLHVFDDYNPIWIPGPHTVTAMAKDENGVSGTAAFDFTVLDQEVEISSVDSEVTIVNIVGEQVQVAKIDNGALILGGVPPYTFKWKLLPTDEQEIHYDVDIDADSFDTIVYQPGEYKLDLIVTDSDNAKAEFSAYPNVQAGPMIIDITGLPTGPVKVNEAVAFTLNAKGSFLINGGQKIPGYEYYVYWKSGLSDEGTITATDPKDGGSVNLSHVYDTPGEKKIIFYVTPIGWKAHWIYMGGGTATTITVECPDGIEPENGECVEEGNGSSGSGTIKSYKNFSSSITYVPGDTGFDPDSADIKIYIYEEGDIGYDPNVLKLRIGWTGLRASGVLLGASDYSSVPYSISSDPRNQNLIPSPLDYGDYTIANTQPSSGTENPTPASNLEYNKSYDILVVRMTGDGDSSESARLTFVIEQ